MITGLNINLEPMLKTYMSTNHGISEYSYGENRALVNKSEFSSMSARLNMLELRLIEMTETMSQIKKQLDAHDKFPAMKEAYENYVIAAKLCMGADATGNILPPKVGTSGL